MYKRDAQPLWSGIQTFLRAPYVDFGDVKAGSVAVAGVPWDFTCGSRAGTRYGPRAIRESSIYYGYYFESATETELVDVTTGLRMSRPDPTRLVDVGDFNTYPNDLDRSSQSMRDGMHHLTSCGAFPMAFGGDHYITFPLFRGFAEAACEKGAKRVGYIQIDHHLDLGSRNLVWGTHWHGSNARRIAELEMVDAKNMCWIGTGGYTRSEQYEFVQQAGLNVFTMKDVQEKGIAEVTKRAIDAASHRTDTIYLTIDIDAVDAAYAPGTGSPGIGGLTSLELLEACSVLARANLGAMDFVEVDTTVDPSEMTARIAVLALLQIIAPKVLMSQDSLPYLSERKS